MAFNLKPPAEGSGDFTPYVKYNAKAGRWYYRNEGSSEDLEIVNPVFAFDLARIQTGWIFYAAGQAPQRVADPGPGVVAEKPPGGLAYKRGFWVKIWNQETGVREFSSCAAAVVGPICEMYNTFEELGGQYPGQAMVCQCVKVVPVKGKKDTNYAPVFELKGWRSVPQFAHHAAPAQPEPRPQAPPRPTEPRVDDSGSRAWQFFRNKLTAEGMNAQEIQAAWKRSFEAYFGFAYDPTRPSPIQWDGFVQDGFERKAPELAAPGTVMPEDDIPF